MSEQFLYFLQQMFNGVTLGSTYALIAIGYTMVYGIIGMINFAHGEVYMVSAYLCAIGLALLASWLAPWLNTQRAQRIINALVGLVMWGIALQLAWQGANL